MSKENVEVVQAVYERVLARGRTPDPLFAKSGVPDPALVGHVQELFDPDVEVEQMQDMWLGHPGTFRGYEGLLNVAREVFAAFADLRLLPEQHFDVDESVVTMVRALATGRESGVEVDMRIGHLWVLGAGRVVRWVTYATPAEAFEAAGLPEGAMTQESVQDIFERLMKAFFADRDVDVWVECFHPDAELLLPRNLLEGGSYRGHAGVRQAFADAFETWADLRFELDELRKLDDGGLALGRTVAVGKGDAPAVAFQSAYLVRLRDGKVAYFRPYQSHDEALEAVGLRE